MKNETRPRHRHSIGGSKRWIVRGLPALVLLCASLTLAGQPEPVSEPKAGEDELGERLVRKAVTGAEEELMARVMRLMNDVRHRLEIGFDPGGETQAIQQRIIEELDEAIEIAAAQRRPHRKSRPQTEGDKRRRPNDAKKPSPAKAGAPKDEKDASAAETLGKASPELHPLDERNTPTGRSWGHLPQRDRDEIMQGIQEEFLERYRAWIERYYRALQEEEE